MRGSKRNGGAVRVYGRVIRDDGTVAYTRCRARDPNKCRYHSTGSHINATEEQAERLGALATQRARGGSLRKSRSATETNGARNGTGVGNVGMVPRAWRRRVRCDAGTIVGFLGKHGRKHANVCGSVQFRVPENAAGGLLVSHVVDDGNAEWVIVRVPVTGGYVERPLLVAYDDETSIGAVPGDGRRDICGKNIRIHVENGTVTMRPGMKSPYADGPGIERREFDGASRNVAASITEQDWSTMRSITEDMYSAVASEQKHAAGITDRSERVTMIIDKLTEHLESDEPLMAQLREYIGNDVSMRDISTMMVLDVSAMTSQVSYSGKHPNVRRALLSRTGNDMNKSRYVSSILFFGGRCCYCGSVMHKSVNGTQTANTATGEHIDPMDGNPPGETKYGNMALCCRRCNADKGNKPFNEWLRDTKLLNDEQKERARIGIRNFHDYTMYEPMSPKQAQAVNEEITRIKEHVARGTDRDTIIGMIQNARERIENLRTIW